MTVLDSVKGAACVVLALLPVAAPGWDGYSPGTGESESPAAARTTPSSDASGRTLAEAESLYRAGRWPVAFDAFRAIVGADPDNAHAWLRIGNLHQRRRQFTQAASAYRRAASLAERAPVSPLQREADASAVAQRDPAETALGVRARALINLAAVNLELAEAALAAYDREVATFGPTRPATRAAAARESIGRDAVLVHRRVVARGDSDANPAGAAAAPAPGAAQGATQGASIEYLKGAPPP